MNPRPQQLQHPGADAAPGRPACLLLYGGTFDPPHAGHLNNLRAAMDAVRPDRVVVMPAGVPPHKAASTTPGEWRLAMCACFAELDPRVTVSRWELDRAGRSYTVNTLEMLRARCPDTALYLALGSDMLLTFTQWRDWPRILQLATLVVQSRQGGDAALLREAARDLAAQGGRVVFAAAVPVPCASRDIRAGTLPPETLRAVLPATVRRVIRAHHLYGIEGKLGIRNEE